MYVHRYSIFVDNKGRERRRISFFTYVLKRFFKRSFLVEFMLEVEILWNTYSGNEA
jgi:hypothetical protein